MSYERYYQSIRKMYPGTIGGQSRSATVVSQSLLPESDDLPLVPPPEA